MIGVALFVFMTLPPYRLWMLGTPHPVLEPSENSTWAPLAVTMIHASLEGTEMVWEYNHRPEYSTLSESTWTNFTYQYPVLAITGLEHKEHRLHLSADMGRRAKSYDTLNYVNFDYAIYT